jgi:hypothetical protein
MSFFGKILDKLGLSKAQAAESPAAAPSSAPAPATAIAISAVDVVAKLEGLVATHAEKLNWKTSIVDLLKLLGLDSSLAARKELATELGATSGEFSGTAEQNMALHKAVLAKLAEHGGNIPKELLG